MCAISHKHGNGALCARFPYGQQWAGLSSEHENGVLDVNCIANWDAGWCADLAVKQNVSATLIDMMAGAGYELALYGRFDMGAGILQDYPGTTGDGWVRIMPRVLGMLLLQYPFACLSTMGQSWAY